MKILNLLVSFVFLFSIPLLNCSDSSPDEPELKVENLTQDRYGLNWIKFEARKPENHGPGVEYEFLVMPAETGPSIHSPGASASPIAHVRLPPGQYVASVKVKDAAGQSSIHSRAFDVRGSSVAGFDSTRVEWGLGESWQLGHASATIAIPSGPMDYQALVEIFSEEPETANRSPGARRVSKASGAGCGSTLNTTSFDLDIASGALSFVPVAGPVLGISGEVVGYMGVNDASACVQSQIAAISNNLAYQQNEITQIADYLSLATGTFYVDVTRLTTGELANAEDEYSTAFDSLMGADSNGGITQFMDTAGLWEDNSAVLGVDVVGLAGNKTNFESLITVTDDIALINLWSVIGSQVPTSCTSNCFKHVQAATDSTDSSLLDVYNGLFTYLSTVTLAPPQNQAAATNFVPDYDSYNSTVVSYYQQSLVALQAGFTMEWLVNQYNFYAAGCADSAECTSTQSGVCSGTGPDVAYEDYTEAISECFYGGIPIASLGKVPGTLYPPDTAAADLSTPEAAAASYNKAQEQLALLYAARTNQLYLNTLNWIFSDAPSSPQAYPEGGQFVTSADCEDTNYIDSRKIPVQRCVDFQAWPNVINFAEEVGSSLTSVQDAPRTPLLQVAEKVGPGDWISDLALYQFPIQNVYKCAATLKAYNAGQAAAGSEGTLQDAFADPLACPPIFSMSDGSPLNGGLYDGFTLQAYSWVEPEDTYFDLSSSSCPEICFTAPAATIAYTCGGIDAGSVCDPTSTAACNNYPATCLPSPNGALSLAYDIPSDWNTDEADTGPWQDATTGGGCTGWDSSYRLLPLGPAWETCTPVIEEGSAPDKMCGNCTPRFGEEEVYSCKSCLSGHWLNQNGILECAEGEPKQAPVFTGVPNSFDNPPTLTTFCWDPVREAQTLTTASCANAQWEFNEDTGQLECGTEPASLCRGFAGELVDVTGASCGDATYFKDAPPIIKGAAGTCAGSYGSNVEDPVCCGQGGTIDNTSYICPADYPICTGYIEDVTWGTCQGEEAYTDCTQCGGQPVLTLSAAMPNNVHFCENGGGGLLPYTLPMSYAGNASGLQGGLPYLTCANWTAPQNPMGLGAPQAPVGGTASTPISNDVTYAVDQTMLGNNCNQEVSLNGTNPPLAMWVNTDWSCTGAQATSNVQLAAPRPVDDSCGIIAFSPKISDGDSSSILFNSPISVISANPVNGLVSGGPQIPLSLVYQCAQNCPGPGGTSDDDHNVCPSVVAWAGATMQDDGYFCEATSDGTGALTCTWIDGQEFSINLVADNIGPNSNGNSDINCENCPMQDATLEVGQTNVACPIACSQCESGAGGETAGGQELNASGWCTGFCSGYNYCGDSNYNVVDGDQAPIDCRQCAYLEP